MALATIAILADAGSDIAPAQKSFKAAYDFCGPNSYLFYIGDTLYPQASKANEFHVQKNCFGGPPGGSFARSRAFATPGNHDNGNGSGGAPNVQSYFNAWKGTPTRTSGVLAAAGVPNTDQYVDIAGWRFN